MVSAGDDRLRALDGWRTISVTLVILGHLLLHSSIRLQDHTSWLASKVLDPSLTSFAVLGVNIFFVISGFVIGRGFLREEADRGAISLSAFYSRRFFRILPPLSLYLAAVVGLTELGALPPGSLHALRAMTFTCNFAGADCGKWLGGHTWSLSVEEQFYLVAPLLFILAGPRRRWIILATIGAIVLATIGSGLASNTVASNFIVSFIYIGAGVVCALSENTIRSALPRLPAWFPLVAVVAMFALSRLTFTRLWLPACLCLAVIIPTAVMGTSLRASCLWSVLESEPMVAMGRVSYSIYLWQQLATYHWLGATAWFYAVSIPACIAFAFISYRWFERPLIQLGARLSARLKHPPLLRTA